MALLPLVAAGCGSGIDECDRLTEDVCTCYGDAHRRCAEVQQTVNNVVVENPAGAAAACQAAREYVACKTGIDAPSAPQTSGVAAGD